MYVSTFEVAKVDGKVHQQPEGIQNCKQPIHMSRQGCVHLTLPVTSHWLTGWRHCHRIALFFYVNTQFQINRLKQTSIALLSSK